MRRLLTAHRRCPALLATALLLLLQCPLWAAPTPGQDASLERLLLRMRRAQDERLDPLRRAVENVVMELERMEPPRGTGASAQRGRLVELGRSAAPLLLPWLEPGHAGPGARGEPGAEAPKQEPEQEKESDEPTREAFRAAQFALALREMPSAAVTDRMLRLALHGSAEGRLNALVALATSPEPTRVQPVVHGIYTTEKGSLRRQALDTLTTLEGPRDVFVEVLAQGDDELIAVALAALTADGSAEFAAPIIALLESSSGARHLPAILRYMRQARGTLDETSVDALVRVVVTKQMRPEDKVELLDTLSRIDAHLGTQAKKSLDPLTRSSSTEVAEATLILLALQRDSRARRQLLAPYDNAIERSKNRPKVYSGRAEIHYKVGDLRAAIRDYKRAVELARGNHVDEVSLVGLARCFALQGKFRDAANYLERAPISVATLHELATDPDFAEMLKDRVGRAAFHLDGEDATGRTRPR
ncbi:MAG: hypothetical protein ACI8QZ_001706 [Chlamydiales bacterium]|jgi:hypothetical protein